MEHAAVGGSTFFPPVRSGTMDKQQFGEPQQHGQPSPAQGDERLTMNECTCVYPRRCR